MGDVADDVHARVGDAGKRWVVRPPSPGRLPA